MNTRSSISPKSFTEMIERDLNSILKSVYDSYSELRLNTMTRTRLLASWLGLGLDSVVYWKWLDWTRVKLIKVKWTYESESCDLVTTPTWSSCDMSWKYWLLNGMHLRHYICTSTRVPKTTSLLRPPCTVWELRQDNWSLQQVAVAATPEATRAAVAMSRPPARIALARITRR